MGWLIYHCIYHLNISLFTRRNIFEMVHHKKAFQGDTSVVVARKRCRYKKEMFPETPLREEVYLLGPSSWFLLEHTLGLCVFGNFQSSLHVKMYN